jgi:hypothetical protein
MAAMVNSPTGCALQSLLAEVDRGPPVPDDYVVSVLDEAAAAAVVGRRDPVDPRATRSCRG